MDLTGKTIAFLGDSITEGVGVENPENRFDNRIAKMLDLSAADNYGISGTRLARQREDLRNHAEDTSFCGRVPVMNPDADVVVILGGVNDYQHGDAPFGSMTDQGPDSFCGAVDYLLTLLQEKYKTSKILYMTPVPMIGHASASAVPCKYQDAKPLAAYVDVIIQRCNVHGVPVLDLFRQFGVDPDREADRQKYMPDGIHPNDAGHERIALLLAAFLKQI